MSTLADIMGSDGDIICTCGRTIIWKRPCICPMVRGRSRRSVPASISTLGPLKPRNASLSPSYHPRLRQMTRKRHRQSKHGDRDPVQPSLPASVILQST